MAERTLRALALASLLLASCHSIALPPPAMQVARLPMSANHRVDEETLELEVSLRRHDAGLGNVFTLEVGRSFAAYADVYLGGAFARDENTIIEARIERFEMIEGVPNMDSRFVVRRGSEVVFERSYHVEGPAPAVRPEELEFGRTRGVRADLERGLHGTLVLTFRAFLTDAAAGGGAW